MNGTFSSTRSRAVRAHLALGLWCEQHGLKAEATAHFTSAVVLDPYRDVTWKHLGYVKHHGRWMTPEQIAAERAEAEAQKEADARWGPQLQQWASWLKDDALRSEAVKGLATVTDPRAVPSVVRAFTSGEASLRVNDVLAQAHLGTASDIARKMADGVEADHRMAVRVLGQIDAPASTRALAELAVLSPSSRARREATETLRRRERRDYARALVDEVRAPMTYQVQPVRGPGSPGALLVEHPRFKMLRTYDAPPAFKFSSSFYGYVGYDANGLPVAARGIELKEMAREGPVQREAELESIEARTAQMLVAANLKALASQQRLIADVTAIETANALAPLLNARIASVLKDAAGAPQDLADGDLNGWHQWWYDQLGYRYEPPAQVQLQVNAAPQSSPPLIYSCFAAGTPVRTLDGLKPIEEVCVGDRVLSQDEATGALDFQPVLVVHHNAPGATLRITLDNGDTLAASVYHRFWRAGRGWAMARELKEGDVLRTRGGLSRVVAVSAGEVVPLFNLDVAQTRTFFVGAHDALVHDNTPPDPHRTPFDAARLAAE